MEQSAAGYQQFATVVEVAPDGAPTLFVFGDVDFTTAPHLETAIEEVLARNGPPVVNFTKVRYLDAAGLSALTRVRKRLARPLTIVTGVNSVVHRVLHVVGFEAIFTIVPELPAASALQNIHA